MKEFNFIYTETSKQVITLIIAPLLLVFGFISLLYAINFDEHVPLWVTTIGFIAAIAITMWLLLNKVVARRTEVVVTDDSIDIKLKETNLFFRNKMMRVELNNIKKFNSDINTQAGNRSFFTITTHHPSKSFSLSQPKSMSDSDAAEFENLVNQNISTLNMTAAESNKIKQGSFFDAPWAKVLTYVCYAAIAAVTIACISNNLPWYQAVRVYCFSLVWVSSYYAGKKRK